MRERIGPVSVAAAGLVAILLAACASERVAETATVWVPPRVDLAPYRVIGMVQFASNGHRGLPRLTSERFLSALQSCQPGVRVLELGPEAAVLGAIGRDALDFQAIREIGTKYGVDALVTGRLDLSELKPKFNVSNPLTALSVRADVAAALVARVFETDSGATIWTGSADGSAPLAYASILDGGPGVLNASDPEEAYGELVDGLVHDITGDFRGYYERQ